MRKRFEQWWQQYQGNPWSAHLGAAAKRLAWEAFKAAALLVLLTAGAQVVRGQGCVPSNIPTNTITGFQILAPSQMPFAAVTLTVSATDGSQTSKKMTAGTGTQLTFNYQSWNSAGLTLYYSFGSGPWHLWSSLTGTSGTFNVTTQAWWATQPQPMYFIIVAQEKPGSGASTPTTQDLVSLTITNQAPGIYYYDGNNSNIYWAITMSYSGIPEVSFADCPAMRTAHHTPTATLQIQNPSSGEVRNPVSFTGTTELAGNTVQAGVVDYISAVPGATITGTYGGVTFCDVDNINFFGIQSLFRIEGAKVVVADLGHPPRVGPEKPVPSSIYDVAPICQNNCDPPDWQPSVVHSFSGRHPYWIGECQLLRAPDADGIPWIPLCEVMTDASAAFGAGLVPTTIQLAAGGLSLPYPGPAPLLPIPGKCTKYPVNVLFSVGPKDLANWFENIPN